MISYLCGIVLKKLTKSLILKVNEVGYEVKIPAPLFKKLKLGETIELYIHTHVREDELSLYGVENLEELKLFKMLIDVPGIGPRLATDLLSLPLEKIKGAILNKDLMMLQSVPGIGKKIAERLIIEMKNKIEISEQKISYEKTPEENEEAMTALVNLGYQRRHVIDVLKKRPAEIQKTEEIIRYFLQNV